MGRIPKKLYDILFHQRCIKCKGFIFLKHFTFIDNIIEGTIECPDCETKSKVSFIAKD